MKKIVFIFAAIALFITSCSQLQSGDASSRTVVSVSGAQVLARVALPSTSNSIYGLSLTMTAGENTETRTANGTLAELKAKTFVFEEIFAGTKVKISCTIKYCPDTAFEQTIFGGESTTITIAEGENNIAIAMQKMYQDLGAYTTTTISSIIPEWDARAALTEYAIPYGYTILGDNTDGIFSACTSLKKVIIPDTVTQVNATWAFYGCSSITEIIFTDTNGWTSRAEGGPSDSIDVSDPATNAANLTHQPGQPGGWSGTLTKN